MGVLIWIWLPKFYPQTIQPRSPIPTPRYLLLYPLSIISSSHKPEVQTHLIIRRLYPSLERGPQVDMARGSNHRGELRRVEGVESIRGRFWASISLSFN